MISGRKERRQELIVRIPVPNMRGPDEAREEMLLRDELRRESPRRLERFSGSLQRSPDVSRMPGTRPTIRRPGWSRRTTRSSTALSSVCGHLTCARPIAGAITSSRWSRWSIP